MRVQESLRHPPVIVDVTTPLHEVARLMNEAGVGAVLLTDRTAGPELVGIVTDRDIVLRGVARRLRSDARVDAVMTPDPITLDADDDIRRVHDTFGTARFRRIPVLREGRPIGVVALDDLVLAMSEDLVRIVRPVTAELAVPHQEPGLPMPVSTSPVAAS
ncbi:MAG TPA: CBS domain-containing protein [Frankiaceae bacterium]|nr:CBS domain-containing protein [Frankiaceae bacterium]